MKHVIISQARNISIRLENWIAYHASQGVNCLIFFDDFSIDSSKNRITEVCKKYSVDLELLSTDGKGQMFDTENSELYGDSTSCNYRIVRSLSRGLDIANIKYGQCICYLIDVDEYIVSDLDSNISDIVENIMETKKIERIYCHSFDIDNKYIVSNWITNQTAACSRWDYESRKQTKFKNRGKSICKSDYAKTPLIQYGGVVHDLGYVVNESEHMHEYSKLRMHHFRTPPLTDPNKDIIFVEDKTLYNKTINII
jgi:hypothetical protein